MHRTQLHIGKLKKVLIIIDISYVWTVNALAKVQILKQKHVRAILQESEAKLEMKFLTPLQFLCGSRLPWGINKNNQIWIGRCIVAVVTALDDVGLSTTDVLTKSSTLKK